MSVAPTDNKVEYQPHSWMGPDGRPSVLIDSGLFDTKVLRHRLSRTGEASLRMCGKSMAPLLPEGVTAKLRPLKPTEKLRGAIVAVDYGPKVVVHRVVEERGQVVVTQGLNAREPDSPTSRDRIIGVVCERDGWPVSETHLRTAASAWTLSIRSLRALRRRW